MWKWLGFKWLIHQPKVNFKITNKETQLALMQLDL